MKRVVACASIAFALAGCGGAGGSENVPEQYIALAAVVDQHFRIVRARPNGSDVTVLTPDHENRLPAISPDGTKIAYVTTAFGGKEIMVMNANGSNKTRLTFDSAIDSMPTWTPDGQQILFHSNRTGSFQVYIMKSDGSDVRQLTSIGHNHQPSVSPDGTRVAFISERDGQPEVYEMGIDGTIERRVLRSIQSSESGPQWSADGDRILFLTDTATGRQVASCNLVGSQLRMETNDPSAKFSFALAPDGVTLFLVTNGPDNLYTMQLGSTTLVPVQTGLAVLFDVAVSN